jgi:hypothetical protein
MLNVIISNVVMLSAVIPNVVMLSVVIPNVVMLCVIIASSYSECYCAKCSYAECHYTKCSYAESRNEFFLISPFLRSIFFGCLGLFREIAKLQLKFRDASSNECLEHCKCHKNVFCQNLNFEKKLERLQN